MNDQVIRGILNDDTEINNIIRAKILKAAKELVIDNDAIAKIILERLEADVEWLMEGIDLSDTKAVLEGKICEIVSSAISKI
jgi:hypothetical protein